MNNLKKVIVTCLVAITLVITPGKSILAATETNLKRVEDKANSIEISVDKFNYEVKSFQLELKIEGDVTLDTLTWSASLNDSSIKKNYTYDKQSKIIKIYVTSKKNLVEYSNLTVGTITVKGELDTTYDIKSNGTFKYIYSDKNREGKIDSLYSNSTEGFKYIATANPTIEDGDANQGNGQESENNSENSGQNNEQNNGANSEGSTSNNQDNPQNTDKEKDLEEESKKGSESEKGTNKPNNTESIDSSLTKNSKATYIIGAFLGVAALSLLGFYIVKLRKNN